MTSGWLGLTMKNSSPYLQRWGQVFGLCCFAAEKTALLYYSGASEFCFVEVGTTLESGFEQ